MARATLVRSVAGKIDRIGLADPVLHLGSEQRTLNIHSHAEALPLLLPPIKKTLGTDELSAIGHRVVHGGPRYRQHQRIDSTMLAELERLSPFDPEHLPAEISVMRSCAELFPDVPQFACFDTAFHRDLPRVAYLLPIPRKYEKHGIRRYGFHGLSCSWLMQQLEQTYGPDVANGRIIIAHLGNGASMTAVHQGRSVDTTMSFTPTAGLVMSRRTGDLDPSLAAYLARTENMSVERFQHGQRRIRFAGHFRKSVPICAICCKRKTLTRAADAVASFCYNAKKHLAALAATMGGFDTLIFSGGIGESSSAIRARLCEGLEFIGIKLDPIANQQNATIISKSESKVAVHVIKTDEEMFIAQTVNALINNKETL